MVKNWKEVRDARIAIKGYVCEECGLKTKNIVGHHIIPSAITEAYKLYSVELCRLRCRPCETDMHKKYAGGNDPKTTAEIERVLNLIDITLLWRD